MKQVNYKKLILPNIPYVFIALLATKLGQAARFAPGTDFSSKALHIMDGLNLAFESILPSFHPADLLVGIAVGVILKLVVYFKGKNAKKFRKNLEYGSARWGTREDIAPFVDPVFENNVILTQTESLIPVPSVVQSKQVCDSKKVTDHHAIIPTAVAGKTDIASLPAGEREVLSMIAKQVLRAVSGKFRFSETVAEITFGDTVFTAKGKTVMDAGWKAYNGKEQSDKVLPELHDGDKLNVEGAEIKEGMTKPPAHFTEDSLLSAMEVAGAKEMPDDAERKGLGTPATRAGIIEKLIATGFVERRKAKKNVSLIPAGTGVSLITVLPEQLQSPLLTAEWEHKLKLVEHGELDADEFMAEISRMVSDLVKTYTAVKGAEVLFPSGRDVVGKCPRCGGDVTESKKGFFCETNSCRFGLWRDNKFLTGKKISLTKKMAATLLKSGRIPVKGIYSEKTGKSYDATLVMTDDGAKTLYSFDFGK